MIGPCNNALKRSLINFSFILQSFALTVCMSATYLPSCSWLLLLLNYKTDRAWIEWSNCSSSNSSIVSSGSTVCRAEWRYQRIKRGGGEEKPTCQISNIFAHNELLSALNSIPNRPVGFITQLAISLLLYYTHENIARALFGIYSIYPTHLSHGNHYSCTATDIQRKLFRIH